MKEEKIAIEQLSRFKELVSENLAAMNQTNIGTWSPSLKDWQRIYENAFLDFMEEQTQKIKIKVSESLHWIHQRKEGNAIQILNHLLHEN